MKRFLALAMLAVLLLSGTPASAATPTYGQYSLMFQRSYGLYGPGGSQDFEWAWSPQSSTESWVYWGNAWTTAPPGYHEQFVRDGAWVTLRGWFDNGTYYAIRTTSEWQAGPDCRTGRIALPVGGPQHYVRWSIPNRAYCVHTEGTITEQVSGKHFRFVHQQVWSPPSGGRISQHEQWSTDRSGTITLELDRTIQIGNGMAASVRQTYPSVWSATSNMTGRWGA